MAVTGSGEAPIGGGGFDPGAGAEAGRAVGTINVNSRAAIDKSAFTELNAEFKKLNQYVTTFRQNLPKLIEDSRKWATELGKVANQMKAINSSRPGGGDKYIADAGSLTQGTNVASGNTASITKQFIINEAPGGGGGAGGGAGAGAGFNRGAAAADILGKLVGMMDSRISRGAEYSLSADRMSMLYQQMSGLSQNQAYKAFREPLQGYKLGMGGINEVLALQARTGLNAQRQAQSIEAMRAASGYAYGTEQIAGMTQALATPQATNQMFMMLGTGMYKIGGGQRTQQEVFQDVIRRTGLTNERMVQGAFQQGSMTRARLQMAGVPDDQIDLLLQYAQQNIAFQKKGGQGFYDPSKKADRKLMGVEGNYANQFEETERVRANREENFYKRQADNFATLEQATQAVTKALGAFEEKLSGMFGARISTKPAVSFGKKALGFGLMAAGILGTGFTLGTSAALVGAGGAMAFGGDPADSVVRSRRRKSRVLGVSKGNNELGGDPSNGSSSEGNLSENNKRKLAQLDPKLREPLKKMLLANPRLEIGDAKRSPARQEASFRRRYSKAPANITKKTKDSDRIWNGEVWIYDRHAEDGPPMAAPGQSMHEIGLAADLSQSENEWIRENAERFGLVHGGTKKGLDTDEPFHVQPASVPMGRAEYEGTQGTAGTTGTGGSASAYTSGSRPSSTVTPVSGANLTAPYTFKYAGMSMGEVIGAGSVYTPSSSPKMYSKQSAGGDPTTDSATRIAGPSGNSFNITVSPNITVQSSGSPTYDLRKMAKDVAALLEQEVRLTMMRMS